MGLEYKFIKVENSGKDVYALFDKNVPGFWGLFSKPNRVIEDERGCADIYKESLEENAKSSSSLAHPTSTNDARRAFIEIRRIKEELQIPFDVRNLETYDRFKRE